MVPKISIIVPVYKVEPYIHRCLDSILAQTLSDFELILVNDGSPDNCGKICDEYAVMDSRIRVIHKENGGLSDARNAGIEVARGEYLGFVDSDDWIKPETYEFLYNLATSNDADIAQCGFELVYENQSNAGIAQPEDYQIIALKSKDALIELYSNRNFNFICWNKLYKRHLFDNIKYLKGRRMEDVLTTPKLFFRARKIVVYNIPMFYYVQRDTSIMGTIRDDKADFIITSIEAYEEGVNYFKDKNKELYNLSQRYLVGILISGFNNKIVLWRYSKSLKRLINEHPYIYNNYISIKSKIILLMLRMYSIFW